MKAPLSEASQIALTLRVVGGLTTAETARAFAVSEATMAQRLTRAKRTIKAAGGTFPELTARDRGLLARMLRQEQAARAAESSSLKSKRLPALENQ